MARVTVEDCILRVPNRFELVMVAAQRTRDIASGASLTVERDNDKNPVVALREIAEGSIDVERVRHELIQGLRSGPEIDEPEEEEMTLLAAEEAWAGLTEGRTPKAETGIDAEEGGFEESGQSEGEGSKEDETVADLEGEPGSEKG